MIQISLPPEDKMLVIMEGYHADLIKLLVVVYRFWFQICSTDLAVSLTVSLVLPLLICAWETNEYHGERIDIAKGRY